MRSTGLIFVLNIKFYYVFIYSKFGYNRIEIIHFLEMIQNYEGKSFDFYWIHRAEYLTEYVVLLHLHVHIFGNNQLRIATYIMVHRNTNIELFEILTYLNPLDV